MIRKKSTKPPKSPEQPKGSWLFVHPVYIIEMMSRYLFLLLVPIIHAGWQMLRTWQGGEIFSFLSSIRLSLLMLVLVTLLGIYRWWRISFLCTEEGIYIRKGIVLKSHQYLAYCHITSVCLYRPWYFKPLGAVRVRIDTEGGLPNHADFAITLTTKQAAFVAARFKRPLLDKARSRHRYTPRGRTLALFALLSSNSVAGAIYLIAVGPNISRVVGQDLTGQLVDQVGALVAVTSVVPPIITTLFLLVGGTWFVSFCRNLLKTMRFGAVRQGTLMEIESGLIDRQRTTLCCARIRTLLFVQNFMTLLMGVSVVRLFCTGYGIKHGDHNLLIPMATKRTILENMKLLLPEFSVLRATIKPKRQAVWRFLFLPVCVMALVFVFFFWLQWVFDSFDQTMLLLCIFAEIPLAVWAITRGYGLFHNGVGADDKGISFYTTKGFVILQGCIPHAMISKIGYEQDLFQRKVAACDLVIWLYGEGRHRITITNLDLAETRRWIQTIHQDG